MLSNSPKEIIDLLQRASEERADGTRAIQIFGGATMDKGQATDEFFVRTDGARISFGVSVLYPPAAPSTLQAYRFHLRYPEGSNPTYIRIDLNRGIGGDALMEPRSHIHVGAESLRFPAPMMTPLEVLEKCLYGLPLPPA